MTTPTTTPSRLSAFLSSLDAEPADDCGHPVVVPTEAENRRAARRKLWAAFRTARRYLADGPAVQPPPPPPPKPNPPPHRWPVGRPPMNWAKVEWSLRNVDIARLLGCSLPAVGAARRRHGRPRLPTSIAVAAEMDAAEIMRRWRADETIQDIAESKGMSYGTIQRVVSRHSTAEERKVVNKAKAARTKLRQEAIRSEARAARKSRMDRLKVAA